MGQRELARQFADDWKGQGNEKSDCQNFWRALLNKIFDVKEPEKFIKFEKPISFYGHTHFIDAYIPATKVLIEQKSLTKNLDDVDTDSLTPFEQALRYAENMDYSERPRWIVTCNFAEIRIYHTQKFFFYFEFAPPIIIKLEDLPDEYDRLKFLVDPDDTTILENVNISRAAVSVIKNFRDKVAKTYDNSVANWYDFLYKFCVRLVFCFYADDSRLFNDDGKFFAPYLQKFKDNRQIDALQKIFDVLSTPENLRGNFDTALQQFPYVNGGLFEEKIVLPNFKNLYTTPIDEIFLANINIHWEKIDPPIFGAMFESALDPDTQRQGGMHYTSVENIHKVIDPLFFDDLRAELKTLKRARNNRLDGLLKFQNKLASLIFFDPACGSGNFLTETYLSIRALENEAIRAMNKIDSNLFKQIYPIKVSIENFYGIEIHPYAVAVAKVAMWIAEHQMLHKTEKILHQDLNPLPLKNYPNIICANALQIDWQEIIPRDKLSYIMGNPPFVGGMMMTREQKSDMWDIWGKIKGVGEMDYVSAWYKKTLKFIKGTEIKAAFVSTNSIIQGQQAITVWKPLNKLGLKINFAYRTFKWINESANMAAVHCVIIGFSMKSRGKKFIYDGEEKISAKNINSYLLNAPQVFIDYRSEPLCNVPAMHFGNMPRDGKNFIIKVDSIELFQKNVPEKFIRPYIGAEEFINGKKRWCLWLKDFEIKEFMKYPLIAEKVTEVMQFRLDSKALATRRWALKPHLFCQIIQPSTDYILVPCVSSENRKYIPMGFISSNVIASNATLIIPDATIYHFGVLTSNVHMAWTRVVCGRLKSDYRYSKDIVYNNFVWCEPTAAQRKKIEETAQKILETRAKFKDKTLAYLYNEGTMPDELRLAHTENDRAVMAAYGFDENLSEAEIVAALMELYKNFA